MRSRLKINKFSVILCLIVLSVGCVTIYNPATERNETLLIDTAGEVSLGRDMDTQVQRRFKIMDEPLMLGRLNAIGKQVSAVSDRQDLKYYFRIIKDKDLNAFAIPGGFIYVHSALMEAANNDELAAVLAHEIGHIAARHSVKKLQADLGYQLIMNIILGLSGGQGVQRITDTFFNIIGLGYSRQDEFLADRLSVKYTRKAGFNPNGAVTFFEKLKKEAQTRGPDFRPVIFSSHPPIEERIKNVKNEIEKFSQNETKLP